MRVAPIEAPSAVFSQFRLLSPLLALSLACGQSATGESAPSGETPTEAPSQPPSVGAAPAGADDELAAEDTPTAPEGPREPAEGAKRIFASRFVVAVRTSPDRDADRIGYLRAGSVIQGMTVEPVEGQGCRGGWWELETGGFVCDRHVVAFEGRRLPERRARQPERNAPLPYEYGFIRRDAPQYRRPPSDEEAMQYEGWRPPGWAEEQAAAAEAAGAGMTEPTMSTNVVAEGMAASEMTVSEMTANAMTASEMTAATMEATGGTEDGDEDEDEEEQITLQSLQGDNDSVVMRTLMRGFWVSLDRDMRSRGRRYWRTQANGFVPYARVVTRRASDFHGVPLITGTPEAGTDEAEAAETETEAAEAETEAAEAETEAAEAETEAVEAVADAEGLQLPLGWVMDRRPSLYERRDNGRFRRARGRVERREAFTVVETVEDGRNTYYRDPSGRWFSSRDVRIVHGTERPSEVGPEDKWLDINLEMQSLIAYVGDTPVYATLISSGKARRVAEPEEDFETLVGLFQIKSKHLTDTMDGDTAVDGPYSVDDVPWVMYFELAYALHGAFWHNGFGYPRSHGCVNLAPEDARWVFEWAGPELPQGWHSVYPTESNPATWVYVHGDTWGRR